MHMVGRWRCLSKRNDADVSDLPELVAACCVLHNICEIHRENFNEDWLHDLDTNNVDQVCSQQDSNSSSTCGSGEEVRKALTTYFKEN